MNPQRVTLITLGCDDLERARKFYESLGWEAEFANDEIVFFALQGMKLGLFGRSDLAKDQGRPGVRLETGAMTLAQNFGSEAEVDEAFEAAIAAGATVLKRPEAVFWGGYSGYFADPDGHVWEFAHNPGWTLDENGYLA